MATIAKIKIDAKEPVIPESMTKARFRKLIENYKIANPVKYEMKKAALEKQLESL